MTDQLNWEKIEVPRGAYIGWGLRPGQHVTGVVVEYSPTGGVDFNQNVCPALAIELVEDAWSADKAQNYTQHRAGELVQLNCGQVSLKRAVHTADPNPGDLVKITLDNILAGAGKQGGDVKEFGIQIVRGYRARNPKPSPAQAAPQQPGPNFGGQPQPAYGGGQPVQQQPQPNFGGAPQPQFPGPAQPNPQQYPQQPMEQPWAGQQGPPQGGFMPPGPSVQGVPPVPPFGTAPDQPPF